MVGTHAPNRLRAKASQIKGACLNYGKKETKSALPKGGVVSRQKIKNPYACSHRPP